jgi:hypothetical protein
MDVCFQRIRFVATSKEDAGFCYSMIRRFKNEILHPLFATKMRAIPALIFFGAFVVCS